LIGKWRDSRCVSVAPCNSEEGVAQKAHRLWDPSKNPACGLVDNAFFILPESYRPTLFYAQKRYRGPGNRDALLEVRGRKS
jgi:hypothetical protein